MSSAAVRRRSRAAARVRFAYSGSREPNRDKAAIRELSAAGAIQESPGLTTVAPALCSYSDLCQMAGVAAARGIQGGE